MERLEILNDPKSIKALTHPLRIKLLSALDGREASPSQLSKEFEVPLGTVSYHVRTLYELGLLELVREERQRGAVEHYYTTVEWVIPKQAWESLPGPVARSVIQSMLSQIGEDVGSAAANGGFDRPHSHLTRDTLTLDEQGSVELSEEIAKLVERAHSISEESAKRRRESEGGSVRRINLVLMAFDNPEQVV